LNTTQLEKGSTSTEAKRLIYNDVSTISFNPRKFWGINCSDASEKVREPSNGGKAQHWRRL